MEKAASKVRIHAYLARLGYGSRRKMEELITEGKISVNGKPAKLGELVDPGVDKLKIRNRLVQDQRPDTPVVIALHKPQGVVTTVKDPEGRTTVMDLVPKKHRVYPIGRLDLNSEGLLLLTNDGELANRLAHPKYEIPKIYDVKIRGRLDDKKLDHIRRGVQVGAVKFGKAEVLSVRNVTKEGVDKYQVRIRVFEGKNHHVRKLFDALRCRVVRLKRVSMGMVQLRGVPRGGYRILPTGTVKLLRKSVGL